MIAKLIAIVLVLELSVNGQQTDPCSMNNGGCSDHCIWLGGSSTRTCSCPCGRSLSTIDPTQCLPDNLCDVDIYVAVDVSRGTNVLCNFLPPGSFAGYITFRDFNVNFLQSLVDLDSGSTYNVGFQTYTDTSDLTTLDTYESPNLAGGIAVYGATINAAPGCRYSGVSVPLSLSLESNSQFPGFPYLGPGTLRPRENTTRIAIITTSGSMGFQGTVSQLTAQLVDTFANYDGIVIIGHGATFDAGGTVITDLEVIRYAACRNQSAPCSRVFWFDRPNSDDLDVTLSNILSSVDLNSCQRAQSAGTTNLIPAVMTQCAPRIEVTIPKCHLLGLTPDQLQLIDGSCVLTATDNGDHYTIQIDYVTCGIIFQASNNIGTYFQRIFTRTIAGQSLPSVEFNITCDFPIIPPPPPPINKTIEGTSALSREAVNFTFALDENFTCPLASGSCVEVNCPLYFKVEALFPPPFFIRVSSCFVSPYANASNSNMQHILANDGCRVDSTFRFLESQNNTAALFTFTMLEFSETYFETNENKLKVYLHCYVVACSPEDASQTCTSCQSIAKRRRRSTDDLQATSLGPFYVERKPTKTLPTERQKEVLILVEEKYQNNVNPWLSGMLLLTSLLWACALYRNWHLSYPAKPIRDPPPRYDASNEIAVEYTNELMEMDEDATELV